ncbi:hypothetical protein RND71_016333 [Anisodus tanguticus]|uniref:Hepcidin n=1 Tax=Anisodus tanguticus TaxID=243964 RepID=A0AAE1VM32_9SOLA|nr:hypothetical protein RND71_016333 [Anisodus tanguticus]
MKTTKAMILVIFFLVLSPYSNFGDSSFGVQEYVDVLTQDKIGTSSLPTMYHRRILRCKCPCWRWPVCCESITAKKP